MASEVASSDLSSESKSPKKESGAVTGGGSTKKEVKLNDLRVADLRTELENRGLDKSGVKASLMERLKKALEDDGKNPEDFVFEITSETPSKKSKRAKESSVVESSNKSNDEGGAADQESDNDEEEDKQNDSVMVIENGEILQLRVDDKEATLDGGKENAGKISDNDEEEEEEENASDSAGELGTATDEAGSDPKMGIVIDDSEETVEKPEEKSEDVEVAKTSAAAATAATTTSATSSPSSTPKTEKTTTPAATTPAPKTPAKPAAEVVAKNAPARNIWITGLSSATRAADLKGLFSQQGKVASVKIVTNAKQISGEKKYYGFITMSASKDAAKAVETLKDTELYGQSVHLELTAHQPGTLLKRTTAKPAVKKLKTITDTAKAATTQKPKKDSESKEGDEGSEKEKEDRRRDRDRERRSREPRDYRPPFRRPFGFRFRGRGRGGYASSFRERIPAESFHRPFTRKPFFSRMPFRPPMKSRFMGYRMRDDRMSRDRFREREIRESERRREEVFRHKMIERKQREEAYRLEREKVQLRIEREMLERERAEILKLEREKQRLERERLEREKEKLRRQTQLREGQKRPYPGPADVESVWEKEKRPRHYESSRYPGYSPKPHMEPRQEYRESPQVYSRHKFEARSDHFERDTGGPSRPDFSKYKDKPEGQRDHDERRVGYKRNYFREEPSRPSYPQREPDRAYAPAASPRDDRFKPRMHDVGGSSSMRAPRSRGGGRRMPYY